MWNIHTMYFLFHFIPVDVSINVTNWAFKLSFVEVKITPNSVRCPQNPQNKNVNLVQTQTCTHIRDPCSTSPKVSCAFGARHCHRESLFFLNANWTWFIHKSSRVCLANFWVAYHTLKYIYTVYVYIYLLKCISCLIGLCALSAGVMGSKMCKRE